MKIRVLVLFSVALVGCGSSNRSPSANRGDEQILSKFMGPQTCEQRAEWAEATLAELDTSGVSARLDFRVPVAAGAPIATGVVLEVSDSKAAFGGRNISDRPQVAQESVAYDMSVYRSTEPALPALLAISGKAPLRRLLDWSSMLSKMPPAELLVTPINARHAQIVPSEDYVERVQRAQSSAREEAYSELHLILEGLLHSCPAAEKLFGDAAGLDMDGQHNAAMQMQAEGLPAALRACNCNTDIQRWCRCCLC